MLIQWRRRRGWRWRRPFLPRVKTVKKNGYTKCCSYIFLMGAHTWILLRFLALVCTVLSEAKWKLQNKLTQSWNGKLFITEQTDMQTQSKAVFFISYNQGKEQSPWRYSKVNIKVCIFHFGIFCLKSLSSSYLYQMGKKKPILVLSFGCSTFKK